MITGADHTSLIIPVHYPYKTLMLRLCIEDFPPLPVQIADFSNRIIPAYLPIIRNDNLIKISRSGVFSEHRSEITEKKAIHGHHLIRQKTIIFDHCRRTFITCQLKRCMQVMAVHGIIVKQQYYIIHFYTSKRPS